MKQCFFHVGFVFFVLMISVGSASAWDPSGSWGIEGRSDATLELSCNGDACEGNFQSAYGKSKYTGYVRGNKLALTYTYLTDVSSDSTGFLVYEKRSENKMSKKAYDLSGKSIGSDNWIRK